MSHFFTTGIIFVEKENLYFEFFRIPLLHQNGAI